ncbi:uncharacterized protein BJ212DRAFT_1334525 [Suillus subaureus]|uniref:Uncharacterized protein n=1 Tax=Suillus subaureus TaxID=48587 RepID=A0A9P7DNZ8_9AGAM|nr:uncharacterized protein BJ212DRAFT_1401944 [Suillus subaureus]XP_041196662.1 uncharacterized protein BJ212DRAFT_1334525 [Suillus subaureus]KAG1799557.1 hypothetical protein BJ212DRAFT_1401944 [Suillus subaureus]KAG1821922.1 hypothetical protein BJ212DRAFT_1334525 [Suillus subaureus]
MHLYFYFCCVSLWLLHSASLIFIILCNFCDVQMSCALIPNLACALCFSLWMSAF